VLEVVEFVMSRDGCNFDILVFGFCWLVGAFCDFGRADTGNPVQNYGLFRKYVLSPGF